MENYDDWVDATILKVDLVNKTLKIRYDKDGFDGHPPQDIFVSQDEAFPL